MTPISNISAVLFDMDGTLVDSEVLTEPVIRMLCKESGVDSVDYSWSEFQGVSWDQVASRLAADYLPHANVTTIAQRLHELFLKRCVESPPAPIPGARDAVIAAHARMPTAIVSSSYRESIETTIGQLGIADYITYRAGAEDYADPKPAPDAFLHVAEILKVPPQSCLVFEDSLAGIQSARAAGMAIVAITHCSDAAAEASGLADLAFKDFNDLDEAFFDEIKQLV